MDIKSILKRVGVAAAETGATAANAATGGALSPLTNAAVSVLKSKLSDPSDVSKLEQAASSAAPELEQLEMAHAEKIAALIVQDRESARGMQVSVKSVLPPALALTVTVGFFGLLYLLIFRSIPAASHDIIIAMVGVLGAAWGAVVNFYFGSSSGSADKNDTIASALKSKA
ncbi:MAG TPA: hypothetical protein VG206_02880 [Terriglobia bacterium]|nr:hypothetical protein [Terriglobia bacterium]